MTLEPINALMSDLLHCRNFGEDYSLAELAARHGLTMETAPRTRGFPAEGR